MRASVSCAGAGGHEGKRGTMTAPKVRADYDQLWEAAARLGSQAEATQNSLLSLEQDMKVLESGDWLGKGGGGLLSGNGQPGAADDEAAGAGPGHGRKNHGADQPTDGRSRSRSAAWPASCGRASWMTLAWRLPWSRI